MSFYQYVPYLCLGNVWGTKQTFYMPRRIMVEKIEKIAHQKKSFDHKFLKVLIKTIPHKLSPKNPLLKASYIQKHNITRLNTTMSPSKNYCCSSCCFSTSERKPQLCRRTQRNATNIPSQSPYTDLTPMAKSARMSPPPPSSLRTSSMTMSLFPGTSSAFSTTAEERTQLLLQTLDEVMDILDDNDVIDFIQ